MDLEQTCTHLALQGWRVFYDGAASDWNLLCVGYPIAFAKDRAAAQHTNLSITPSNVIDWEQDERTWERTWDDVPDAVLVSLFDLMRLKGWL